MRKVIINENQRGLLFKDGRYVKMLDAGKYYEILGRSIEICETSQPIHPFACDLETLLKDKRILESVSVVEVADEELRAIVEAAEVAAKQLDAFRKQEGEILIADLLRRIDLIEQYRHDVEPYEAARVETIKSRIRENIEKMQIEIDHNRLEQEMIYYIEKLDITEEKVRLDNHCNYFREVAATEDAPGRKLGFIAQELGREINTMGSKSNEAEMQRLVVKMKDELEKIKEQVLNIL